MYQKLIQKDVSYWRVSEPFIYGETSISNLVKDFQLIIFKPLVYIGVLLMLFYWSYIIKYLKLIKKEINIFTVFGILSAIFLFFSCTFLGNVNNNRIIFKYKKINNCTFYFI